MALIIRNKNKYTYAIKLKIKRYIYSNFLILKNYLKLKEIFIKGSSILTNTENALFKKIFIETVSYCNNDCTFCSASSKLGAKNPNNFMSEDLYMKIFSELADISYGGSVAFHCNNEPLLDKRLASWIKVARRVLKNNFFYLYTNSILINAELANQLFAAGLNRIIVNNYNDTYEAIPSVKNLINKAPILTGEVIINFRIKTEYLGNRAGQSPNSKVFLKEPLKIICLRPLNEIIVGYDGTVPLCCADGLWKVNLGNLNTSGLKDIWFSDNFKKIRRLLIKGDRSATEICKACDALNFSSLKGIRI